MIKVTSLCGLICLGKQGENLARVVYFDEPDMWKNTFGEGTCELIHQRSGDEAPYPVKLEIEDGHVCWKITNADTAVVGDGKCELHYIVNDVVVKSKIWTTTVLEALSGDLAEPPEPQQSWVDEVLSAAQKVEDATVHAPIIGDNGDWWLWDFEEQKYIDIGVAAEGKDGVDGEPGTPGADGKDGKDGDKGDKGDPLTYDDLTDEQKADLLKDTYTKSEIDVKIDKKSDTDIVANALIGFQKGEVVKIEDVSPLTDIIKVKAIGAKSVKKQGKNVLPYPYYDTAKEKNGLTFTDNGDGSITVNGTSTAFTYFYFTHSASSANINDLFEDGKTYVIGGVSKGAYVLACKDLATNAEKYYYKNQPFTVDKSKYDYKRFYWQASANVAVENVILYPQIEIGTVVTEFEPYKAPTTYSVSEDGTVEGVTALHPTTTLVADTQGVVLECEYNRDINKAFAELQQALISMGANL